MIAYPDKQQENLFLVREQQLRRALLQSFSDTSTSGVEQLCCLSSKDWKKLLSWLHISGLALYFLERMKQLDQLDILPGFVLDRLEQNQRDNIERTQGMANESAAIQLEFQKAGISYLVLKGISLWPSSVPRPELRHQFDLDFLVSEENLSQSRNILERRGYRLHAISGHSLEFKINQTALASIEDTYKDQAYRTVELHLEHHNAGRPSRLGKMAYRRIHAITMPVLSPVDLFLAQALHAFKDICSEFTRAAHLLEFYRHVLYRRDDHTFWQTVYSVAQHDSKACIALGVLIRFLTSVMGEFAPVELQHWTLYKLPSRIQLWVDRYGQPSVFADVPGKKLYLLLQKELELIGIPGKRSIYRNLLPAQLPFRTASSSHVEPLIARNIRYQFQTHILFQRLRFHLVEGVRYGIESWRWQRYGVRSL